MSITETTYYQDQLDHVNTNEQVRIQLRGEKDTKTNWLNLNEESAQDLVDWLTINYLNK